MYEVEIIFGEDILGLKAKIKKMSQIHNLSEEIIWKEYENISNTQMTESRKWQYINSQMYKRKGEI